MSDTLRRPGDPPPVDDQAAMSLIDHIRELRTRLLRSVLAIGVTTTLAWFFYDPLIRVLTDPVCIHGQSRGCGTLVITGVINPLATQLKVSLAAGLVLATPIWLYQLWAFIAPGLHRRERRWTVAFVGVGAPLFLGGGLICYWILPKAINVLLGFTPGGVNNLVPLDEYLVFVIRMILLFGVSFELPLVLVLLNVAGVLSAARMASWWRWMIVGIFVFAAIATPTGDPLTMTILAGPMCLLYAAALGVCTLNDRRRGRTSDPDADLSPDEAAPLDTRPSRIDDLDDIP